MIDEAWFALHDEYLRTDAWHWRRQAVLTRDHWVCQAQMIDCNGRAEQVHHLSYRHWRNEPLFDLISVCAHCHAELTRMDRENRTVAPDGRLGIIERAARYGVPIVGPHEVATP